MNAYWKHILNQSLILVAIAFACTWFGIYDSGSPFLPRLLMWTLLMLVGGGTGIFVAPFVFGTRFERAPVVVRILVGAAMIAVPVTLGLVAFHMVNGYVPNLISLAINYVYVLAVCIVMMIGSYLLDLSRGGGQSSSPETTDGRDKFLERLPLKYRKAELYAVSSEDHYLRVHTNLGEELVLMRMADAARELASAGGLRTHRSWWVAKSAVESAEREGSKALLTLKSGTKVPVSRTYQSDVKDAGLL